MIVTLTLGEQNEEPSSIYYQQMDV